MAAEVSPGAYKDVVLFLATAGVVVPAFKRLKISPVLGFLVAGVALGPFGLGALVKDYPWLELLTVSKPEDIAGLAQLGVVFLLFMVGLELSWERLRLMRQAVFGLGAAQVALGVTAIGGVALALGQPLPAALAIGAALTLSSTAVVVPLLTETKRMHAAGGRASFAILLFQDLAVAPILVTLTLLGVGANEADVGRRLALTFAPAAIGVVAIVVLGRLLLRPMFKSVARAKSDELFMAAALLVVIGSGLVAALAGLSMALGAFVAGILLAETEFRHEVEVLIEPFKGLLLGLFFVSLGIGLDLTLLAREPGLIVGVAVGLVAMKAVSIFGLARVFGLQTRTALETALPLAAAGEFAFVILESAMGDNLLTAAVGESVLVAATLTMFLIPGLSLLASRIGARARPGGDPMLPPPEEAPQERVLVVGYGRVGRLVGEMMDRHEVPWVAMDRDPRLVEAGRRSGAALYFGDASRPEFLRRCGLESARAVVVTMDAPESAEAVVATARSLRPNLTIVARARDARHARRLYDLGATDAVPETVEASLQLSEAALVDIGIPMGLVIASIHQRRDEFRTELNRPDGLGGARRRARDAAQAPAPRR
jgi:CPA2 family monovalent cation:H+ antiporter-2